MKITIPANELKALLITAGKKDIRFHLNAIHIDLTKANTAVFVSTDGIRLTAITKFLTEDYSDIGGVTLGRSEIETFLKAAKGEVTISVDGDSVTLANGNSSVVINKLVCNYPEWRSALTLDDFVYSDEEVGTPVNVDLEYLADLQKIHKLVADMPKKNEFIVHHGKEKNKVLMTIENRIDFLTIVMGLDNSRLGRTTGVDMLSNAFR